MAVQNNQSSMQAELIKRDEIINQMRQELGQKGGQQVPAFFNPHTPVSSVSQNKTTFLPTQSNSLQSQTMTPQTSSSGMGHWNSLHPNRNINMAARSNM